MGSGPLTRWFGWFKRSASAREIKQIEPPIEHASVGIHARIKRKESRQEEKRAFLCCDLLRLRSAEIPIVNVQFSSVQFSSVHGPANDLLRTETSSRGTPDRSIEDRRPWMTLL
jgi:hypothetical protein